MVFSSLFFLWFFLPLVLGIYYLVPKPARNYVLLLASLGFYAYGEGWYTLVMGGAIVFNWIAAIRKWPLAWVVCCNILALLGFKYLDFFLGQVGISPLGIHLPIGISFFLFQAMSYVMDVRRGQVKASRNLFDFGTYLSLFPQLIAGPIVRYAHVANQLQNRKESLELFASGVERFVLGLGKKVLLANTLARGADAAFGTPVDELGVAAAWWGGVCYMLQIYFDFSGYSDMAVGLGRMFGFRFLENFNLPYKANSIQDFWRRWHISLSTWFRDYLYIPLGGNRKGPWMRARNQLVVFALCGFWHGASWTFLLWGIWHGFFLGLEALWLRKYLERGRGIGHLYALLAILGGWVLFRADTISAALDYYGAMLGWGGEGRAFWDPEIATALTLGSLFALGIPQKWVKAFLVRTHALSPVLMHSVRGMALLLILLFCLSWLAAATTNPFIYFRF